MNLISSYISTKLKLWTGVLMLFYVFTHFLNHSLGLLGLTIMEQGRVVFDLVWRNPVSTYVFVTAVLIHFVLTMKKLLGKKTMRGLRSYEYAQIVTGVLTPTFLIPHILHTKLMFEFYGVQSTYLHYFYTADKALVFLLLFFLSMIWLHGIIGLTHYLYLKPWFSKVRVSLVIVAVLMPTLAGAGILSADRELDYMLQTNPEVREAIYNPSGTKPIDVEKIYNELTAIQNPATGIYLALVALGFLLRSLYLFWRKRRGSIKVAYPGGSEVVIFPGSSLLDASLYANIPHAHVCGGRGRCSTCRIKITEGEDLLESPSELEQTVLKRINAAEKVRLACQTYPKSNVSIVPILPSDAAPQDGFEQARYMHGTELKIAVLFADLRGFTKFSEKKLPFDLVFILNQYFDAMGRAIERRSGYLDKFIGDGTMALFGLNNGLMEGCKNAVEAAYDMQAELEKLNKKFEHDLPMPLKMGIGIHCGEAIVGKMGYKHTSHLTALGDIVNTASRLESLTKDHGVQLIVSGRAVKASGFDFSGYPTVSTKIRGRDDELEVHCVADSTTLPVEPVELKVALKRSR